MCYIRINNNVKNTGSNKDILVAVAFVLFCLVFAIYSLYPRYRDEAKYNELKENGCWILGEFENIHRSDGLKGTDTYHAYGTYIVDGQEYKFDFSTKSKIADVSKIRIFYDEKNPSYYVQDEYFSGDSVAGFIFLGLAFIVTILEFFIHIKLKKADDADSYNFDTSTDRQWNYNTAQNKSNGNVGSTALYKRKK